MSDSHFSGASRGSKGHSTAKGGAAFGGREGRQSGGVRDCGGPSSWMGQTLRKSFCSVGSIVSGRGGREGRDMSLQGHQSATHGQEYYNSHNYFTSDGGYGSSAGVGSTVALRPPLPLGLFNQGMTCALNSVLQTLFWTPEFHNAVLRADFGSTTGNSHRWQKQQNNPSFPFLTIDYFCFSVGKDASISSLCLQLQKLFLDLKPVPGHHTRHFARSTVGVTDALGWTGADVYRQRDANELFMELLTRLQQQWPQFEDTLAPISPLFKGLVDECVKCGCCPYEKTQSVPFFDLQLAAKNLHGEPVESIYNALCSYIGEQQIDDYDCGCCGAFCGKVSATKSRRLVALPYLLAITLKRFEFVNGRHIKLGNRIEFPLELDPSDFVCGARYGQYVYELYSVVVHSGSTPHSGHYFAYIKNLDDGSWHLLNDSRVSKVASPEECLASTFGDNATSWWKSSSSAYMLFYRKKTDGNQQFLLPVDQLTVCPQQPQMDVREQWLAHELWRCLLRPLDYNRALRFEQMNGARQMIYDFITQIFV